MPIHFVDSKCHIKQLKAVKSHKTCLTNHTQPISHHIMPLVINSLGVDIHIIPTHESKQFQETRHAQACGLHMPV